MDENPVATLEIHHQVNSKVNLLAAISDNFLRTSFFHPVYTLTVFYSVSDLFHRLARWFAFSHLSKYVNSARLNLSVAISIRGLEPLRLVLGVHKRFYFYGSNIKWEQSQQHIAEAAAHF